MRGTKSAELGRWKQNSVMFDIFLHAHLRFDSLKADIFFLMHFSARSPVTGKMINDGC